MSAASWNAEEARRDLEKANPELYKLIFDVIKQGTDDAYRRVRDQMLQDFRALERDTHKSITSIQHSLHTLDGRWDDMQQRQAEMPPASQVDAIGARLERLEADMRFTVAKVTQSGKGDSRDLRVLFRELRSEWGAYTASEHKKRMDLKAELKRMIDEVAKTAQHADEVGWKNTKIATETHAIVQGMLTREQRRYGGEVWGPAQPNLNLTENWVPHSMTSYLHGPRPVRTCSDCHLAYYQQRQAPAEINSRPDYCACGRELTRATFKP